MTAPLSNRMTVAALSLFEAAGIDCERIDDARFVVASKFILWPESGLWRSGDGQLRGYSPRLLIQHIANGGANVRG